MSINPYLLGRHMRRLLQGRKGGWEIIRQGKSNKFPIFWGAFGGPIELKHTSLTRWRGHKAMALENATIGRTQLSAFFNSV